MEAWGLLECCTDLCALGRDVADGDPRHGGDVADYRRRPQRAAVAGGLGDRRLRDGGDHHRRGLDSRAFPIAANPAVLIVDQFRAKTFTRPNTNHIGSIASAAPSRSITPLGSGYRRLQVVDCIRPRTGDPDFHELEPDGGMPEADRGAPARGVNLRNGRHCC